MSESASLQHRRMYCFRCGQLMFEFYRSPDGHFGLSSAPGEGNSKVAAQASEFSCPFCRAPYRLLERLNSMGHPVERK